MSNLAQNSSIRMVTMDNYKFSNKPLTPTVFSEIALCIFTTGSHHIKEIEDAVRKYHVSRGGIPLDPIRPRTKKAFARLKKQKIIRNGSVLGYWDFIADLIKPEKSLFRSEKEHFDDIGDSNNPKTISASSSHKESYAPVRIIGTGNAYVYLYYNFLEKQEAEQEGMPYFPCKIGRATSDPGDRILAQTTGMSRLPVFALAIKTSKPVALEAAIHALLKFRGRSVEAAQGREWFETNPEEVIDIHEFMVKKA